MIKFRDCQTRCMLAGLNVSVVLSYLVVLLMEMFLCALDACKRVLQVTPHSRIYLAWKAHRLDASDRDTMSGGPQLTIDSSKYNRKRAIGVNQSSWSIQLPPSSSKFRPLTAIAAIVIPHWHSLSCGPALRANTYIPEVKPIPPLLFYEWR